MNVCLNNVCEKCYLSSIRGINKQVFQNHLKSFTNDSLVHPRIEISVNTDISILGFYGYIENIGEISVDIFHQISVWQKLSKIDGNA